MKRPGRAVDWTQSVFLLPLTALFFIGQVCGALYAAKNQSGYLHYFLTGYLNEHFSGAFTPVFSLSFLPVIGVHLLLLVLSVSCAAAPVIVSLPFIKGFSIGMISASLYISYGLKGILINLVLLWLPAMIQSVALIAFSCESMGASVELFRSVMMKKGFPNVSFYELGSSFVLWSAAGLAAAFLEGVFAMLLGGAF